MRAVLVIDMPEGCGKCRLADFGKCRGSKSYIHMPIKGRPKECPLRPLPNRRDNSQKPKDYAEVWIDGAKTGWNACLDEITGETE